MKILIVHPPLYPVNIDLFNEGLSQYKCCMDYDLFVKFAMNNAKIKFIREFLGCFRIHGASKTSNLKEIFKAESEQIRNPFIIQNETIEFLIKNLVRVKRLLHYLFQGDIGYILILLKRLFKRNKPTL